MPKSISTRAASGSGWRDGRRAPLAGSPGVAVVWVQNARTRTAVSESLAAFRVNVEKPYGMQPAADFEDVPFQYDWRRVRALHVDHDG